MLVSKETLVSDFPGRIKIYDLYEDSLVLEPTVPLRLLIAESYCMSHISTGKVLRVFLLSCSSSICQEETSSDVFQ